jgi:hypothetical protein
MLGFVVPYLFGLLPHGYSMVDNVIRLVLGILGLLAYANIRLSEPDEAPPILAPDSTGKVRP